MKATVFLGPKKVKILIKILVLTLADEVLIKTRAVGISGYDLCFYLGKKGIRNLLNHAITHVSPSRKIIRHETW